MHEWHYLDLERLNRHPQNIGAFYRWLTEALDAVQRWLEHPAGIDEADLEFCTAVVLRASQTACRLGAGHLAESFHKRHLHADAMSVLGRMLAWTKQQATDDDDSLSTADVARRMKVSPDKVLAWIRSGELRATNTARQGSKKPIWRIDPNDLKSLQLTRSNAGIAKPSQRKRRRASRPDVNQFY